MRRNNNNKLYLVGLFIIGVLVWYYTRSSEGPTVVAPPRTDEPVVIDPSKDGVPCQEVTKWYDCSSDAHSAERQRKGLKKDTTNPEATCDSVGICTCQKEYIFNGIECVLWGDWKNTYDVLRTKWFEVPFKKEEYGKRNVESGRISTSELLKKSDDDLLAAWTSVRPKDCFTDYYVSKYTGKKVLDIGAGFARQSLQIALGGAHVTFLDVVQTNLDVIKRLCKIHGIPERCDFVYLENLETLDAKLKTYDVMLAFGTMHHVPREVIEDQMKVLFPHLKTGGYWLQLAYPVNRWNLNTFPQFGKETDGSNTPWGEWYEPGKLQAVMDSTGHTLTPLWCKQTAQSEFIWFESRKTS